MRQSFKFNRYRPRLRSLSNGYQDDRNSKIKKTKCSSTIKIIKLISAILVPFMIGIFTIVTTIQESKSARLQREADAAKIERQAQLQHEAEIRQQAVDALKIKEQQERDDMHAKEIRIQNIYDTFMRDISSIVLKDKNNITIPELLYARSKTLLTLEQIDAKRKSYLIKFLYDSKLLYANNLGMNYIDLSGTDLSNIRFGVEKQVTRRLDLRGIRLSNLLLLNATFDTIALHQAQFDSSDLNNSNFNFVTMVNASFRNAILENTKFILSNIQGVSFENAKLKLSSWSPTPGIRLIISNIDYSNSDLSESIFQNMRVTTDAHFAGANFERINFIDITFSTGAIFNNLNMKMATFSTVEISNGKFIQCDLFGALFEECHFKGVIFENVDLRQSQFNGISKSGTVQFNRVNLNGSNLNISENQAFRISDSFLPNGTFKTSSVPFKVNLIKNGDAEHGQCDYLYPTSLNSTPQNWSRLGNIVQIFYKNNNSDMNIMNYINDWHSCFFFGGDQNMNQSNSQENILRQEINVEQLSILINSRQAKYNASAYLGGFADEQSSTVFKISFKNTKNKVELFVMSSVTNVDRQNQTAMLFRSLSGTIPNGTISIIFELIFQRQKSHNGFRFGMADNLSFSIQQK